MPPTTGHILLFLFAWRWHSLAIAAFTKRQNHYWTCDKNSKKGHFRGVSVHGLANAENFCLEHVRYSAGIGICTCSLRRHAPCPLPHAIKLYSVLRMNKPIYPSPHPPIPKEKKIFSSQLFINSFEISIFRVEKTIGAVNNLLFHSTLWKIIIFSLA